MQFQDPYAGKAVQADIGKASAMKQGTDTFKLAPGEMNVPFIPLRTLEQDVWSTKPIRKHWWDGATKEDRATIPCRRMVGEPCFICDECDAKQKDGSLNKEDDDIKKFLRGSENHILQGLDGRAFQPALAAFIQANQSGDTNAASAALGALHDALLKQPVVNWYVSPTLYTIIVNLITGFTAQMGGKYVDPTYPGQLRPYWVSRPKPKGNGVARYEVAIGWQNAFPLPAGLYDGRIKSYDELYEAEVARLVKWPEERIRDLLIGQGQAAHFPSLLGPQQVGPALPAGQPQQALPPAYGAGPPPAPTYQQAIEAQYTPVPTPQPRIDPTPTPIPAPGASVSAAAPQAQMACFGTGFNMADAKCQSCGQSSECLAAAGAKMKKTTAPAEASAPQPPVATPPASAPTPPAPAGTDPVLSMVDAAFAEVDAAAKKE